MTIIEALKLENGGVRLATGSRWMYWDDDLECWIVLERPPHARKNVVLTRTPDETDAIDHLLLEE